MPEYFFYIAGALGIAAICVIAFVIVSMWRHDRMMRRQFHSRLYDND